MTALGALAFLLSVLGGGPWPERALLQPQQTSTQHAAAASLPIIPGGYK